MQALIQSNLILLLILVGATGLLAGCVIYKLTFSLPKNLEKNWRIQSWQYLYPRCPAPTHMTHIKETLALQPKNYLCIAFLTALFSVFIAFHFGPRWTTAANLVLMWGLLLLACIDFKYGLLPDCLTLPLLWLGLFCNSLGLFVPLHEAVWGAMIGYLSLWLIAAIFKHYRNKEGIGQGDFKLLAVLGAWWGFYPLLFIVMVASLTGTCVGLVQMARSGHSLQKPMPFGPYLIFAGLIVMFFNEHIKYILC